MTHVVYNTLDKAAWRKWVLKTLDEKGWYSTMERSPLPLREAAVSELAAEGKMVKRGKPDSAGYQEWRAG